MARSRFPTMIRRWSQPARQPVASSCPTWGWLMRSVLRQRNFGLLWMAGLISLAGDWMLRIALPIYVYRLTGSALATSTMLIAGMLPDLLFGSIAVVFVDRWDRK